MKMQDSEMYSSNQNSEGTDQMWIWVHGFGSLQANQNWPSWIKIISCESYIILF